jgi:hypothetical protein
MEHSDGSHVNDQHVRRSAVSSVAAFGATWAIRRGLASAYVRRTGHNPPTRSDRSVPLRQALAWAILTAVAVSVAQVLIDRAVSGSDDATSG